MVTLEGLQKTQIVVTVANRARELLLALQIQQAD